ncbi:MAG: hypothetical protein QXZ66_09170, partial [Thermoproteota archaeon]
SPRWNGAARFNTSPHASQQGSGEKPFQCMAAGNSIIIEYSWLEACCPPSPMRFLKTEYL